VPRFKGDNFYAERGVVMPVEQRIAYAEAIRRALATRRQRLDSNREASLPDGLRFPSFGRIEPPCES